MNSVTKREILVASVDGDKRETTSVKNVEGGTLALFNTFQMLDIVVYRLTSKNLKATWSLIQEHFLSMSSTVLTLTDVAIILCAYKDAYQIEWQENICSNNEKKSELVFTIDLLQKSKQPSLFINDRSIVFK